MSAPSPPEVWLQGPVPGVPRELMPVVHSLLQVRAELETLAASSLPSEQLWARPGGAASVGFHVIHLAGSLDRLLTYARGEGLNSSQRAALEAENSADPIRESTALFNEALAAIDLAIAQVTATPVETLGEARRVGRGALPSTVRGLLFHAAEHAQRHAGQIVTTAKVVAARRP
ncbi:MAG: DinB family protein [Acidobacteriota bacterium]